LVPAGAKAVSEAKGPFFLKSAQLLEKAPNKAPAEQYLKMFGNPENVKKEEQEWAGVTDYLKRNAGQTVTKDQIRQVIDDNGMYLDVNPVPADPPRFGGVSDTQGGKYTLAGGDPGSYQEMLFTLPSRTRHNVRPSSEVMSQYAPQINDLQNRAGGAQAVTDEYAPQLKVLRDRISALSRATDPTSMAIANQSYDELKRIKSAMSNDPRLVAAQRAEGELNQLKDEMVDKTIALSGGRLGQSKDFYEGAHWTDPKNYVAHTRFDTRTIDGKKTLFVHEVQSDWHQFLGKYAGWDTPESRAAFTQKRNDAARAYNNKELEFADQTKNALGPDASSWETEDRLRDVQRAVQYENSPFRPREGAVKRTIDDLRTRYGDDYAKQAQEYADAYTPHYVLGEKEHRGFLPNAPFKQVSNSRVENLALKYLLQKAANEGYDQIAWAHGDVQHARYASLPDTANALRRFYGTGNKETDMLPNMLNKLTGKYGSKMDTSAPERMPEQTSEQRAQARQQYIDQEMDYVNRAYPEARAATNEYTASARQRYIDGINQTAEERFGGSPQEHQIFTLKMTPQLRDAYSKPQPLFKRGGGVPHRVGGGFAGSTPWYTRQEARGMVPHGMLGGSGMGRTDTLPISVPSGAYVVPADIVSGIGQGNSHAGASILGKAFGAGPLGMPVMHGKGGFGGPKNIKMGVTKMPTGSSIGSALTRVKPAFQYGGPTDYDTLGPGAPPYRPPPPPLPRPRPKVSASPPDYPTPNWLRGDRVVAHGGAHPAPPGHTPIVAASGEYIIHPSVVLRVGKGNMKRGHDVLDALMKDLRKKHVKELQKLPGPVKRG
jgi:hypothetical protein